MRQLDLFPHSWPNPGHDQRYRPYPRNRDHSPCRARGGFGALAGHPSTTLPHDGRVGIVSLCFGKTKESDMSELENPPPLAKDAAWPQNLVIRARRPSDAEGIVTLHNLPGYRYGTLRTPHHTPDEIRKGIESQPANVTGLIALLDGRIVGDAGLTRFSNRRVHVGSIGMGVHDAYIGKGIGRALIGEVVALADDWFNLRRVELTVYTDNEPAIRLYEKNGFVTEGLMKEFAFRDGSYVDAYCMARIRP